jgi:hypothetical protein
MAPNSDGLTEDDIWSRLDMVAVDDAPRSAPAVSMTGTPGIAPARPGEPIPAAVQDALFADPSHQVYAVLDAARVFGLPERLAASGHDAVCLFQGAAFDEMADIAPWLVQLDADAPLLRALFTSDPEGRHPAALWDAGAGICLSAPCDITAMRAHLRRFVRVTDDAGQWFFLRFWQPEVALDLAHCLTPQNAQLLFGGLRVVVLDHDHVLHVVDGPAS